MQKRHVKKFTCRGPRVQDSKAFGSESLRLEEDKPEGSRSRGLRDLFANTEETAVGTPVIAPPIEVQVALGIDPAEIRNVADANDLGSGAETDDWIFPLLLGIFGPVSQQMFDSCRLPWVNHIVSCDACNSVF